MAVVCIDGRRLGTTVGLNECCFEVALVHSTARIFLVREALLAVEHNVILRCTAAGVGAHYCGEHVGAFG